MKFTYLNLLFPLHIYISVKGLDHLKEQRNYKLHLDLIKKIKERAWKEFKNF